ncbi:uncharacterized protein LOC125051332 [Pieris napi]|uniref:uncharacterized protein LOC125051332 n=1 Tax=Pieris napi TaxID=78633 RepID=UPI001FB8C50D|nr:uncharacterized protein LOC125051332 [Pieris napi]
MVVCELDKEVSGEILGWKLPAWQAILLHRVLPSFGGLINYLVIICFDLALVVQHYQSGNRVLAGFCIILIYLPAIISLVFSLASPPPTLQPEGATFKISIQKSDLKWIFTQIANAIFFPIAAIRRYSYLIFWWVEAVYASRSDNEERTRDALMRARTPSPIELYLFLQAFIHSAPHAVVNILDMMANFSNPVYDTMQLQAVTIVASSLRMASTATIYRRFEREKICGRRYPWNINVTDDNNASNKTDDQSYLKEEEPIYETISHRKLYMPSLSLQKPRVEVISDMIQFSPRQSERTTVYEDDLYYGESDTSSDYMTPAVDKRYDSDDEYIRPVTIIDRVAPRRSDAYKVENVAITPPPVTPAPRIASIAVWAEKLVENAENLPTWLSAPPRRRHLDLQTEADLPLPRHIPSSRIRGLEPPDVSASFIHFLGWYGFFISRLLSLAAFINLSSYFSIIVLFIHYQIMLLFLIVPKAPTVRRGFYIFLAFIYLFCLMEFKVRFRHVRVWHLFWFLVCTAEIVIFISLWATINNPLHFWWKNFVVLVTLCSMAFSYLLFLIYFVMLQPREIVVNIKSNKNCK